MIPQILIIANVLIFSIFNIFFGKSTCGEIWSTSCVNDNFLYSSAQVNPLVVSGENVYQLVTSISIMPSFCIFFGIC